MAAKVDLQGFADFRAALRALPEDLAHEGSDIVVAHATEAQREIRGGYPQGPTGNLRRGVTLDVDRNAFGTVATVKSHAQHAHLYEAGTKRRTTRSGANRGVMPPAPEGNRMIPKVIRIRARMRQALIELVKRAGFTVTG
jgi:hypothetical protein